MAAPRPVADPARDRRSPWYVGQAVASGRRSRAIYPVRALHEAPDVLARAPRPASRSGVSPELPTRMLVIGGLARRPARAARASPTSRGAVIRQPGIVEALTCWFDALWEPGRARARRSTPRSSRRPAPVPARSSSPTGAHDEQIARKLGISLRTVRRRVADLMTELGADTRFQAGVEAARRGWL